jgi:predicted TIM-barrel fold metal-dependent hydrolase
MFGSDQMVWSEMIGRAIATIESAPGLTESQRRDIFYNNAARFLRLQGNLPVESNVLPNHHTDPAARVP